MIQHKKQKGQAVVEMALVLPIFLLVIIGIFDFGRALHCWSTLNYQCMKAARAATRRIGSYQLVGRNVFSADTHMKLGQEQNIDGVWDVFWKYKSPLMSEENYQNLVFEGVGTGTRNVTISSSFQLTLITPMLGSLVGGSNGDGAITINASVTEEKE